MITIDSWFEMKMEQLKARDMHRNLQKTAPLQAFVMLAKTRFGKSPQSSEKWSELYKKFKMSGKI